METYTYSEARQKLAAVLDQAAASGKVLIRRRDGRVFALTPQQPARSPLDVPSVRARISTREIISLLHEGRRRSARAAHERR